MKKGFAKSDVMTMAWTVKFLFCPGIVALSRVLLPPILCPRGALAVALCRGCDLAPSQDAGWAGSAPSGKSVSFFCSSLRVPEVLSCPEGHLSECSTEFYLLLAALSFDLQSVTKNVDVWFSLKWGRSSSLNLFSSYWILARAPVDSSSMALLHDLFLFPLRYTLFCG